MVGLLDRLLPEIALDPKAGSIGLALPLNKAPPVLAKRSNLRWEGDGGAGDEDWSTIEGERSVSWLCLFFWATS